MAKPRLTQTLPALITAAFLTLGGSANACMMFSDPDPAFWEAHATTIVDATVLDYKRDGFWRDGNWVLALDVHAVLRGEQTRAMKVVTRMLNTTIVDRSYVKDLLGKRAEFALLHPCMTPVPALNGIQPMPGNKL